MSKDPSEKRSRRKKQAKKALPEATPSEKDSSEATKVPENTAHSEKKTASTDLKSLNYGRLFFGFILIFVGLAMLGETTDLYQIQVDLFSLWPTLIIALGLTLLSRHGWLSLIIALITTFLVITLLALASYVNYDAYSGASTLNRVESELISIPYEPGARAAVIKIKTGAGRLSIDSGGGDLLSGRFDSNFLKLDASTELRGEVQEVQLETQGKWRTFKFRSRPKNILDLSISSHIPIDLYLKTGAMRMDVDLSEVKARIVEIDSGASTLRIVLGDLLENSEIKIKSGVSSIDISVPSSIGARVEIKGGLVSKRLSGFKELEEGVYETENYRDADKKTDIFLNIGVSNLKMYQS